MGNTQSRFAKAYEGKKFFIHSNFETAEKAADDDDDYDYVIIKGYASTPTKDRHNDVIPLSAWNRKALKAYKANPVILYQHKHADPVGFAMKVGADEKGLYVEARIHKDTTAGDKIMKKLVRMFSVGFYIKDLDWDKETETWIIKKLELLEISVVSLPANGEAKFNIEKQIGVSECNEFKKQYLSTVEKNQNQSFMSKVTDQLAKLSETIKSWTKTATEENPDVNILDQPEVQKELDAFQEAVTQKEAETAKLQKEIDAKKKELEDLKKESEDSKKELEKKAADLQKQVNKLQGKETPIVDGEGDDDPQGGEKKELTRYQKAEQSNMDAMKDFMGG